MKRGDVILVREPSSPASKARPCIVIQRSSTLEGNISKVTVCALTSKIVAPENVRPLILPGAGNGLRKPSAVQVDWIYTHPVRMIGETIGTIDDSDLALIDTALRNWLDI